MLIFTILSIAFVYWEIKVGQPAWFYNTIILFALGGWFALFQEQIECIVMKNDYVYIVLGAIMAVLYWISFKNRNYGIKEYSVWAGLFTLAVVMITMKISIKSTVLEWIGKRVFSIYILQRIPMIILTKTGFTQNSPYTFFVLAFLITLGIAVIFDYMVGKLDNVIVKHLVKE